MAPSISLLCILFTLSFLSKRSLGASPLELGFHFLDEPEDIVGVKGKSISLPCRLQTNLHKEIINIVWYFNNKRMDLKNDKRRTVFQNGTLYFSKLVHKMAGHSDQGEYRCVGIIQNGSLSSKPAYLRISTLPDSFSLNPNSQEVEIGSNARLICGIPSRVDIVIGWEKNEQKLLVNALKYATASDSRGSILYILNVAFEDSGSYRCIAKNIFSNKQRRSSSGLLTVLPQSVEQSIKPFKFLSAQQSVVQNFKQIKEGDSVSLNCITNVYKVPILGWTFTGNGQNITRKILNLTNTRGCSILELKNVSRHDAGWYACKAMDLASRNSEEFKIQLKVTIAPEIREKSDSIMFRTSKTIRFRCLAFGNPIPEMHWLKDGNFFNFTGRIKHKTFLNESLQLRFSELILSSTVTDDAGIYQCMAKNVAGWAWAASRLILNATKPAPDAPDRVSCEPISSTQIKLMWDVRNTSKEIKAFSIHYHLTEYGEELKKVVQSNSRSIQIDKLLPFSNYTFYLRLYMDSASEFSEKAVCQTEEEVPIEAPEKKIQIISSHSIFVSWIPLNKEKARGKITKYKIQWRHPKSPSSKVVEVVGNVHNYTITSLHPGKQYDIRVLAATSKGWPESDLPWETVSIPLTFNSNVPLPPEVYLQPLNASAIEVKWSLPHRETKIVGYKIYYRKLNNNQVGPIIVPAEADTHIITGLEPETRYEIMVLGFTKEVEGETGSSLMHTLSIVGSSNKITPKIPLPEPPISLEADPLSPSTINLTWSISRASSSFKNIKHFTVCFNAVQSKRNKNMLTKCIKSLENKISVSGLNPFTLYEFRVRSHNFNDEQSGFSQAVECHTLEDVPSQVMDISWKTINQSVIQVSWKEPKRINGILKNYFLYYTDDSTLLLDYWNVKVVSRDIHETQLTDLTVNVIYYLIIRASTNAGLGSYASPKQFFIPSQMSVNAKQSDQYMGIAIGLGIGICCITLCIFILCRRRCLKRHVLQDFEVTSCRRSNGNIPQRRKELITQSYFTFLSRRREEPNGLEVTVRHLNVKSEQKTLETEKAEEQLNSSIHSKCSSDDVLECKTPLLFGKARVPSTAFSFTTNNNTSELSKNIELSSLSSETNITQTQEGNWIVLSENKRVPLRENCSSYGCQEEVDWLDVNAVLRNPEFKFSNTRPLNADFQRNFDSAGQCYLNNKSKEINNYNYNNISSKNGSFISEIIRYNFDYNIYKNPKLPLYFVSKQITQES